MSISSGHDQVRHEDFSFRFRPEQQCNHKARRPDAGADQHWYRKTDLVMAGKPGQNQWNKAAKDRALVVTEGAGRGADLGREAFRKVGGVLAVDRLPEKALQDEAD